MLSGHRRLSDQFSKSQLFAHTNAEFLTCVRQLGRGHSVAVPLFDIRPRPVSIFSDPVLRGQFNSSSEVDRHIQVGLYILMVKQRINSEV